MNRYELRNGTVKLTSTGHEASLVLSVWETDRWRPLSLIARDDAFVAEHGDVRCRLRLSEEQGDHRYRLSFESQRPTRLQLRLEVPQARDPFHVIPGVIFGDNNLGPCEPKRLAHLTTRSPDLIDCAPYWEFRADRASHPVSAILADGLLAAISIQPYSEQPASGSFIRNGLCAQVAHENDVCACGVTLGAGSLPTKWAEFDQSLSPQFHLTTAAEASGQIFLRPASSRLAMHELIRDLYREHRETPRPPISREEAIEGLIDAFLRLNWHDETGRNSFGTKPPKMTPFFSGQEIRNSFTNMRCNDASLTLTAWRTLVEIGWSGGTVVADPLLQAGRLLNRPVLTERALAIFDRIAAAHNPASGFLWDVVGEAEGQRANWWWSHEKVMDRHCAYTNGMAVFRLLRSYVAEKKRGHEHPTWLGSSLKVLDTIARLQLPNGSLGYAYALDRPAIIDEEGFAGVWFVSGLVLAFQITGQRRYLETAQRAARYYDALACDLNTSGTQMDCWKAPSHEGTIPWVLGTSLLHQAVNDDRSLEMFRNAACLESLWRFAVRARPAFRPLKDSHWNSCGAACSHAGAGAVHQFGLLISADLARLATVTGDSYFADRCADGVNWGINTVSLWPDVMGYGIRGVQTEQHYVSDGGTTKTHPGDGSPTSIWYSYNGWASAAVLECLIASESFESD